MKKNSLILVVLIAISGVVKANEIDNPKSSTGMSVMKQGSTFKVFYKGERPGTVKLKIYNAAHKAVFTETLKNVENFVRPYNFSSLPEGDYTIELINEDIQKIERINYSKGRVEKLANLVRLAGTDGKYMLRVANKSTDEIKVDIYNDSNQLIYSQKESITGDFARIYDLHKVQGHVFFVITDKNGITKTLTY